MSGGSFDYLYMVDNLRDMVNKRHQLSDMHDALSNLDEADFPGAARAAAETKAVLEVLEEADEVILKTSTSLGEVWHAVEWWHSNDQGPDDVAKALANLVPSVEKDYDFAPGHLQRRADQL